MFTSNIGGVPALKMVPLHELDTEVAYLSGDQSTVVIKDANGAFSVFDLENNSFQIYDWNDTSTLLDDHPSCAMFFPSESVKVAIRLEIMGGGE